MNDRKLTLADWAIIAVLLTAVGRLYAQTLQFEFVNYDDDQYVYENPRVLSGLTFSNIGWAFTTGHASNWHPLTWLSHMLDAELFGRGPAGPHGVNAVLHAVNSALAFVVVLRLTGARWPSAVVAGLFALHPLRAESVAWVSERKDVLSGLFFFLTILFYHRWTERPTASRYAITLTMLAAGLLAKPMLVTLPCLLLLLDCWPLGRLQTRRDAWPRVREKLPMLALVLASSIATFLAQSAGRAVAPLANIRLDQRLANAAVAYVDYLRDAFWPAKLAFFYPHPYSIPGGAISPAWLVICIAILITITAVVLALHKRHPWATVGWFWYVGMMVPVIGIVQVGSQARADRYTYLTTIGIAVAVVFSIVAIVRGRRFLQVTAGVVAGSVLVALVILSYQQIGTWRNTLTMTRHAIGVVPNNYAAFNNLGHELDRLADRRGAEAAYREVLRIRPHDAIALNNVAVRLAARGETREAMQIYRNAILADPTYAPAYMQLGNLYARQGRVADAVMLYEQAVARDPTLAEAYHNFAVTLAGAGDIRRAIELWQQAIELNPNDADVHHAYGLALLMTGEAQKGVIQLRRAMELQPGRVDTRVRLAWTLATHPHPQVREPAVALQMALEARKLSDEPDATLLDTLAAAQAAIGDFAQAVESAEAALDLSTDPALSAAIEARRQLYLAGKAYVQGEGAP